MGQNGTGPRGPRCIALVGPFQSGKTTLLEAILARTGAIQRQGTVEAGTTVGDASKEARHHKMSVEVSVATTNFMGDNYTFLDCPGSVEFIHDMRAVLPAIDAAIVVCEADEKKVPQLQLILRELEDLNIPHILFLNKIDKADKRVRETLQAAAAGLARAAGAAANSDLARRHHYRLRRSRARARLCLQGARGVGGGRARRRRRQTARRTRASPCWRRWPTTTTSSWSSCSKTSSRRATRCSTIWPRNCASASSVRC